MSKVNQITISYERYEHADELPARYGKLLEIAHEACDQAYAPYSQFHVGAAILTESGQIIDGANQENASFPIGACAERVALYRYRMGSTEDPIAAIAVTAKTDVNPLTEPVSPCGNCRQLLVEQEATQQAKFDVIMQGTEGPIFVFKSAHDLMPLSFDSSVFLKSKD